MSSEEGLFLGKFLLKCQIHGLFICNTMYREMINIYDGSIFVDFVNNPHSQIVSNDV